MYVFRDGEWKGRMETISYQYCMLVAIRKSLLVHKKTTAGIYLALQAFS